MVLSRISHEEVAEAICLPSGKLTSKFLRANNLSVPFGHVFTIIESSHSGNSCYFSINSGEYPEPVIPHQVISAETKPDCMVGSNILQIIEE